jgi:hypothetical protein
VVEAFEGVGADVHACLENLSVGKLKADNMIALFMQILLFLILIWLLHTVNKRLVQVENYGFRDVGVLRRR